MNDKPKDINGQEICHVCGRIKKPYMLLMTNNIFNYLDYEHAREEGPICERCDQYFALTHEFKDASEEEFQIAVVAQITANILLHWWESKGKMDQDDEESHKRSWPGTEDYKRYVREYFKKHQSIFKEMVESKNVHRDNTEN